MTDPTPTIEIIKMLAEAQMDLIEAQQLSDDGEHFRARLKMAIHNIFEVHEWAVKMRNEASDD